MIVDGQPRGVAAGDYACAERPWRPGDVLILELPIAPRWTYPDPRLDAVRGTVAVERGPLVYCLESIDLAPGLDLERVAVITSAPPIDGPAAPDSAPEGAREVTVRAVAAADGDPPRWPYSADRLAPPTAEPAPVSLVPFYARANRGPAAMRVFLPEHETDTRRNR